MLKAGKNKASRLTRQAGQVKQADLDKQAG